MSKLIKNSKNIKETVKYFHKFFILLLLLLFIGCGGEFDGFYKTTSNSMKEVSCKNSDMITISRAEEDIKYFILRYQGFSLSTYVLEKCDNVEKKDCKIVYYLDPDDITESSVGVVIDQTKSYNCGKKGVLIKGTLK